MYDYGLSTLTQYGIEVKSSSRTRGALVCRTEQGILLLREFHGSEKKLLFQQEVLKKLSQEGCLVDTYIENQEGSLVTRDKDNIPYTLQNWYEGRECDTKSREDIIRSVQILARVHKFMNMPVEKAYMARSLADEYARHNQEIRKIRKFIRQKLDVFLISFASLGRELAHIKVSRGGVDARSALFNLVVREIVEGNVKKTRERQKRRALCVLRAFFIEADDSGVRETGLRGELGLVERTLLQQQIQFFGQGQNNHLSYIIIAKLRCVNREVTTRRRSKLSFEKRNLRRLVKVLFVKRM